jgi:hypothetical protein
MASRHGLANALERKRCRITRENPGSPARIPDHQRRRRPRLTNPPAWDSNATGIPDVPPGCGNFLAKVGGRPGIPFHVDLTQAERGLNDTNKRWHHKSRIQAAAEFAEGQAL